MPADQSYYLDLGAGEDNVSRPDHALIPNCTGLCVLPSPFMGRSATGREDYYLQYLVKGEMNVWIDGKMLRMVPGQAILYYPHTAYQYTMRNLSGHQPDEPNQPETSERPQEVQYYWVHFTGFEATSLVARCGIPNHTFISVSDGLSLRLCYEGLFQDFIRRDPLFELSASTRITTLLVNLGREYQGAVKSPMDSRIQNAIAQIHQRFREDLSIEQLSSDAHLSVSRFRSIFKEQTGFSPKDYLTSLRLSRARMLLEQTGEPLSEIAEAVGYPDQLYFSRIFRERVGLSPSEYRKESGK